MFFTLLLVLVGLLFLWRNWVYSFWKRNQVPCPEPTFPIGNLGSIFTMKKHSGEVFRDWYKKFNDLPWMGYYKITSPAILVRDLDLIKDILFKDFASFQSNDVDFTNDDIMKKNPFVLSGQEWKHSRAILSPLFTLHRCKQLFPLMQPAVQRMKEYLQRNGSDHVYDAKTFSSLFTTENVVKCGYSMDAGCFENPKNEFREMGKKIFQPSFITGMKFIVSMFLPIVNQILQFKFLSDDICTWLSAVLKNNLAERRKTPLPHEDLMQWLLNGMEQDRMDESEAISHAFSFFIEGFETSSGVMSISLYALAKNEDVQSKLRGEMKEVLERHDNQFTFDALQEMDYLDGVVSEAMRLYPPGLAMAKRCTQPYPMPLLPGQSTPFTCQPGTSIVIPVYAIHMDPNVYADPETFNPERFSESERKNRHKAAYLPFGEGPRMCLGSKFAMTQIKLAIAHLVLENEVILESPKSEIKIDPEALMYQSKEDLMIKFRAIKP